MPFGDLIALRAIAEFAAYGGIKEAREPLKSRIREYYQTVGANFDGGDTAIAWSAAFVSTMVDEAGGGDHFPYNILHSEYVYRLIMNWRRGTGVFRGWDPKFSPLRLGDILASNRRGKALITFDQASSKSSYFSHCDIVTRIVTDTEVIVTGGNVGDQVAQTAFRKSGGVWRNAVDANHQVFCLIRAVDWPGEDVPAPNFTTMRLPKT